MIGTRTRRSYYYYPFTERSVSFRSVFESPFRGDWKGKGGGVWSPTGNWRDGGLISNRPWLLSQLIGRSKSRGRLPVTPPEYWTEPLRPYSDRRLWHPDGVSAPATSFNNPRHQLKSVQRPVTRRYGRSHPYPAISSEVLAFRQPNRVLICVRRKVRKEVLHALGKTGGVGQRKPRFNEYSSVHCI